MDNLAAATGRVFALDSAVDKALKWGGDFLAYPMYIIIERRNQVQLTNCDETKKRANNSQVVGAKT